jgi:hypothetical protein
MARNGAWRSIVIDQTPRSGRSSLLSEVIAPLWEKGYEVSWIRWTPTAWPHISMKRRSRMAWSASSRPAQRFPGIKLILNRGFEIVPRVRDKIQMVAAESLYRGWDANLKRYVEVPAKDRDWLAAAAADHTGARQAAGAGH